MSGDLHEHVHGRTAPDAPIEPCPRCAPLLDEIRRLRALLDGAQEEFYVTATDDRVGFRVSNLPQAHQLAAIHRRWQAIDGGEAWVESRLVTQRKRVDEPDGGAR